MNIAMMHFRTGETDGVSLEMDKWRYVLEKQGHNVIYIAGSGNKLDKNLRIIEELHYKSPINDYIVDKAYVEKDQLCSIEKLKIEIEKYADVIEGKLLKIIQEEEIELLIPNNVLSLGWNLGAGIATAKVIEKTGIKAIAHHHDFHWERELYSSPNYEFVSEILESVFPPQYKNLQHVVINGIAKRELKKRYGIEASIVPNVFDFEGMEMEYDGYNSGIKKDLGLSDDAIIFLQATRIVERKGIELAIDVISKLNSHKQNLIGKELYNGKKITSSTEFVLAFAGLNESKEYYQKLINKAKESGVKVIDVNHRISHKRQENEDEKIYSFWDAYLLADFITYPSLLEGFGNQFLEAIFAQKPLVIYEYPVFEDYIKGFGFEYVSLGNTVRKLDNGLVAISDEVAQQCAVEVIDTLTNGKVYEDTIAHNYNVCKKNFSYSTLESILASLIGR